MEISHLAKLAAGRCWAGYEPVPGKAPYSNDSCRPAGSKKKKKTEKKAANPAMRDESGLNLKKPETPKSAPYGSTNFNADAIQMLKRIRQAKSKQASDIQTLAKLAADTACTCDDTVSTCKCGPDCKCRKEGGSCYRGEKQAGKRGLWDNIHAKRKRGEKPAKPGEKDYPDSKSWTKTVKSSSEIQQLAKLAASPAWQRSEGKNSEGGLNAKGRASYNASTGGNLKAPVTSKNPEGKDAARKASFCARMGGMKSKLTGEKTKNDPDSRINKALRKWNC